MPLGIDSAWSWGEVFFYGVPSSGHPADGHLLNASFHGPVWLTGGAFGPEASWANIALLVIWWLVFSGLVARSEIPEPCRDPRSPDADDGTEDSVLIMTRRSL